MARPSADAYSTPSGDPVRAGVFAGAGPSALSGSATAGTFSAAGGLISTAPSALDASRKYRFQQKRLFQRARSRSEPWTYVNSLGQTITSPTHQIEYGLTGGAVNCHVQVGASSVMVCTTCRWKWATPHGDYLDAALIQQGPTPFASVNVPSPIGAGILSVDITAAMQFIHENDRWVALLVRALSGSGALQVNGVLNSIGGEPPTIEVVYTDATTAVLPAWYTSSTITTTNYLNAHENLIPVSGAANGLLEFDRHEAGAAKTIASATLKLRHGGCGVVNLGIFVVAPPIPDLTPVAGLASTAALDADVALDSRVLVKQLITDAHTITDVLDVGVSGSYSRPYVPGTTVFSQRQEFYYDPSLWDGPVAGVNLATKHPHKNYNAATKWAKWFGSAWPEGVYADMPTFSVVPSTYALHGFTPLAPGLGAIHLKMPARGIQPGQMWRVDGEVGTDVDLAMPRSHIGAVRRIRIRYYVLLGDGWEAGEHQRILGFNGNVSGVWPEEAGFTTPAQIAALSARPSDNQGKFFGGAQQLTGVTWVRTYRYPTRIGPSGDPDDTEILSSLNGGYGTGSGGQIGYQGRMMWTGGFHQENGGPAEGGLSLGLELYDMQANPTLPPSQAGIANWDTSWQSGFNHNGALAHIYPDGMWRCVELEWKLNDLAPYEPPPRGTNFNESGFTKPPNGYLRCWIDGVLSSESPNFGFSRLPKIDWALQDAQGAPLDNSPASPTRMRPITSVTDEQYLGFATLAGNFYYGGRSPCPVEKHIFINGLVVAVDDGYIGPMLGVDRAHGGLG